VRLYPDYGLFLLRQGGAREVHHFLYDFPLDHITVVGSGQFTTMKNHVFAGIEYAMSLDFDSHILASILRKSPRSVVTCVRGERNRDPVSPRSIQLPQTLALGVEAMLGELQRGLHDEFIPLVIAKVLSVTEVGKEGPNLHQSSVGEADPRPVNSAAHDFMHIVAPRSELERCTIEPTLKALEFLGSDPETALRFQNNVMLSFQGYDLDVRGLFEIEEVRKFVAKLNGKWYSWFFFMTKDIHISPLAVILLCLCRYTISPLGLFIPVVEDENSKRVLHHHFGALRAVCRIHHLPKEQTEAAVQEVVDYLMKVGFVSGCDAPQLSVDSAKTSSILPSIG
jgi:hypothetical protein